MYEVVRVFAEGGQGRVYRAWHRRIGKRYNVEVLLNGVARSKHGPTAGACVTLRVRVRDAVIRS